VKFLYSLVTATSFLLASVFAQSNTPSADKSISKDLPVDQIIQKFAEKETEFYNAWLHYTFKQSAVIRILSVDGAPSKESMTLVSTVVIDEDGEREIKPLRRTGNLRSVVFTREDQEVFDSLNPFALRTEELPFYNLKYEGKEKVDELDCHVFSAKTKNIKKGRKYFEGKVWVDDRDLQIVRTVGKTVPQSKENQIPEFETIRQLINGKYWFPIWMHADSRLRFPESTVRIEQTVTYENYENAGANKIIRTDPK
jgi:outer membrane lipoprotein-sorting protein